MGDDDQRVRDETADNSFRIKKLNSVAICSCAGVVIRADK